MYERARVGCLHRGNVCGMYEHAQQVCTYAQRECIRDV